MYYGDEISVMTEEACFDERCPRRPDNMPELDHALYTQHTNEDGIVGWYWRQYDKEEGCRQRAAQLEAEGNICWVGPRGLTPVEGVLDHPR